MAKKPAVRQMRGPGMNKGLKKPRHGKFPSPGQPAKNSAGGARGGSSGGTNYKKAQSSYLSGNISDRPWGQ